MSPFDCGSQAQVEHRLGCRLGKAEPVSNIEIRIGDGFDTALGEEAVHIKLPAMARLREAWQPWLVSMKATRCIAD